uniref:Inositol-tetrakisphosphate 1-kinase N-terminal domain-containing protein n=1 Tax=Knipowitschia caucasica TaxID=637954 RepID=A0AAV2J984_KNICA
MRRVGFYLSDKKRRKMNLDSFSQFCEGHGIQVIEIDLSQALEPQGPFDIIIHKLSDVVVEAEHDSQSQQLLHRFQRGGLSHIFRKIVPDFSSMNLKSSLPMFSSDSGH